MKCNKVPYVKRETPFAIGYTYEGSCELRNGAVGAALHPFTTYKYQSPVQRDPCNIDNRREGATLVKVGMGFDCFRM